MTRVVALALLTLGLALAAAADDIPRPTGYRDWTHVKSMVILPGHPLAGPFGGMHHVYVNDAGRAAAARGGPFPDGTTFVFDLLASEERDHADVAGARKLTAVMVQDRERFASTGGWEFQAFKAGEARGVVQDAAGECFGCHRSQETNDYVLSRAPNDDATGRAAP